MKEWKTSSMKKIEVKYGPYRLFDDGEGHRFLIPVDEYEEFEKKLKVVEEVDGDDWYTAWSDLLDGYDRLEGESYLVILENEVISGI